MTTDLLAELEWRGLKYQHTAGLAEQLAAGRVSAYCGFDPTADSLHVGSLVQLMGLSHLHRAGHRPVVLVGGGTGLIGDPSGKANERPLADQQTIEANTQKIAAQIGRFLAFDLVNNAEWLTSLNLVEFLRDVGKHFTVNYMLQKDSVNARMEAGISFTEFSYMLLQAYDFLELYRRQGVTLQIGGSDQWGNITAGIELIRRATGAEAHALTLPLVTNAAGTKFGKTESGTIWLDPAKTSPYQFYQFWINIDDRDVGRYLRYFTLLTRDEIDAMEREIAEHPERREAQRALARDVTTRVHGSDAAASAARVSAVLFGAGALKDLTVDDLGVLRSEMPYVTANYDKAIEAVDIAAGHGIVASKGEARRLIQQGGLYVNDRRVTPETTAIGEGDLLAGRYVIMRKGARSRTLIEFV
ncbi:MAG TPA: tyrosine--tRNA ligase [Gemmatimonadaceae bacterium]|nr:tyrosine--tRNA ligase [Gemmatimonadaceae bacterium]